MDIAHTHITSRSTATAYQSMVATASAVATEATRPILAAGGNAVDAAVAAAWALAVCEPSGSGLGGQTVALVYLGTGQATVVDGHSRAPASVSQERVSVAQQRFGHRATTVPTTPGTLGYLQARYGKLSLQQVMEPAIRLAEDGYPITELQRRQISWCRDQLRASPAASALFLRRGEPPDVGEVLRQPELASTLKRIALYGTEDFYRGAIARAVAKDMARHDGLLVEEDLARWAGPCERAPLSIGYRGYRVLSAPPPGGGLQLLLGLKLLERLMSDVPILDRTRWYVLLAEITALVFRERERRPLHPDELTPALEQELLDPDRIRWLADEIDGEVPPSPSLARREEGRDTTHLCTADAAGNVVALTQSIHTLFGAKAANPELGFLYNNYLATCPRRPHPCSLGSGCLPRSNMAPTLVLTRSAEARRTNGANGERPILALGAAGGRRIISALLQVTSALLDRGVPAEEVLEEPRFHSTVRRTLYIERPAAAAALLSRLEKRFPSITIKKPRSFSMGAVQAIWFHANGKVTGLADPRRDGAAAGL